MNAEDSFAYHIKVAGLQDPEREYKFHSQRKWRFDFAWPSLMIAAEIEGITSFGKNKDGSMKLGRHQSAKGYELDCEKYNAAALAGWSVFRFTQKQVRQGVALNTIETAIKLRGKNDYA